MSDRKDLKAAKRRAAKELERGVLVLVAAIALGWAMIGPASHWYACQQLAPIERAFTRGC